MEGTNTNAEVNSSDMRKFLCVVNEAELNQPDPKYVEYAQLMAKYDMLTKEDLEDEGIKQDLENILRAIPSYMDILISQTMMLSQMFKMGKSPKKITAKNIITQIQFS